MKVHVQRKDLTESTTVTFEFSNYEVGEAERLSAEHGILRPPRLDFTSNFKNMSPHDWIQYVVWLTRTAD